MKASTLLLTLLIAFTLSGCKTVSNMNDFDSLFVFKSPSGYTSSESDDKTTISGDKGRLEIFKTASFEDSPLGEPIHGFSSSGLDEFESKLVPKEKLHKNDYSFWLFYAEKDEATKKELHSIFESFSIKK